MCQLQIWLHLKTHLFLYFDLKTPNFENIWSFPLQTLLGALWKKCAQFWFLPFERGRRRQKSSLIAFFLSRSNWVSVDRHTVRNISSSLLVWKTQFSFLPVQTADICQHFTCLRSGSSVTSLQKYNQNANLELNFVSNRLDGLVGHQTDFYKLMIIITTNRLPQPSYCHLYIYYIDIK